MATSATADSPSLAVAPDVSSLDHRVLESNFHLPDFSNCSDPVSAEMREQLTRPSSLFPHRGRWSCAGPTICPPMLPVRSMRGNMSTLVPCNFITGRNCHRRNHQLWALVWSQEGHRLYGGTRQGSVLVWSHPFFGRDHYFNAVGGEVMCIACGSRMLQDVLIIGGSDGCVRLFLSNSNLIGELFIHSGQPLATGVRDVGCEPGDARILTVSVEGAAAVWDTSTAVGAVVAGGTRPSPLITIGTMDLRSAHWHPSWPLIVGGSKNRYALNFYDVRVHRQVGIALGHHKSINKVRWCPNNEYLCASASVDTTLRVWDTRMMSEIHVLEGHTKEVNYLDWHPISADLLASASGDGSVGVWMLSSGRSSLHDSFLSPLTTPENLAHVERLRSQHNTGVLAEDLRDAHAGRNIIRPTVMLHHKYMTAATWFTASEAKFAKACCVAWHPLGTVLVSGGADATAKFWGRLTPGNLPSAAGAATEWDKSAWPVFTGAPVTETNTYRATDASITQPRRQAAF